MLSRRADILAVGLLCFGTSTLRAQTVGTPAPATAVPAEAPAATASISLPVPVMAGPLALSPVPPTLNAGPLGTWYVDGAFSAIGLLQDNPNPGDRGAIADIGNAQIFVQKIDGLFRFYVQLGAYALPALSQTYANKTDASDTADKFFDPVPQAFLKIAPSDAFSVQVGKLPTLIGDEYTFTFENVDIERGLLWSQEPAVSRGVQANYITGPVGFSVSLNDGFYSNRYSWVSGSASWTINPANVLVFAGGANLGKSAHNDLATPLYQNNSRIFNLIYTYTKGKLMVSPYLQYSNVPRDESIGIGSAASLYGGAVLATYTPKPEFSMGMRLEYEASTGAGAPAAPTNLLYGPRSDAASITLTPTYVHGHWFLRAEAAALTLGHMTHGDGLGNDSDRRSQLRGLIEAGYLF